MAKRDQYTQSRAVRTGMNTAAVEDDKNAEIVLHNIEDKFNKNKSLLIKVGAGIAALAVLFIGYKMYKGPQEQKANDAIQRAETYFMMDSLNWVLNGDGTTMGMIKAADKYSGTKAGNRANYYAGVSYLKKGDAKNAIKYLKKFDANGTLLGVTAAGALGDAYWETGDLKSAAEQYTKAAADEQKGELAGMYQFRLGVLLMKQNKTKEAIEAFRRLKTSFGRTSSAREADKYLGLLGDSQP